MEMNTGMMMGHIFMRMDSYNSDISSPKISRPASVVIEDPRFPFEDHFTRHQNHKSQFNDHHWNLHNRTWTLHQPPKYLNQNQNRLRSHHLLSKNSHSNLTFPHLTLLPTPRLPPPTPSSLIRSLLLPRPPLPSGFISLLPAKSAKQKEKEKEKRKLTLYFDDIERVERTFGRVLWSVDWMVEEGGRVRDEIESRGGWWSGEGEEGEDEVLAELLHKLEGLIHSIERSIFIIQDVIERKWKAESQHPIDLGKEEEPVESDKGMIEVDLNPTSSPTSTSLSLSDLKSINLAPPSSSPAPMSYPMSTSLSSCSSSSLSSSTSSAGPTHKPASERSVSSRSSSPSLASVRSGDEEEEDQSSARGDCREESGREFEMDEDRFEDQVLEFEDDWGMGMSMKRGIGVGGFGGSGFGGGGGGWMKLC